MNLRLNSLTTAYWIGCPFPSFRQRGRGRVLSFASGVAWRGVGSMRLLDDTPISFHSHHAALFVVMQPRLRLHLHLHLFTSWLLLCNTLLPATRTSSRRFSWHARDVRILSAHCQARTSPLACLDANLACGRASSHHLTRADVSRSQLKAQLRVAGAKLPGAAWRRCRTRTRHRIAPSVSKHFFDPIFNQPTNQPHQHHVPLLLPWLRDDKN